MNKLKIWLLQALTKYSKKECTYAFYGSNQSFSKTRARLTLTSLSEQKLQAIFDLVIEKGYYLGEKGSDYMCIALQSARHSGVITTAEFMCAKWHIDQYLTAGAYALEIHLLRKKLDASKTARMAIYKNWLDRP